MKLIIQPDAGVAPVVTAIKQAKKSIDILIFRLDRGEITRALEAAVGRGVAVRALIAHTHSGSDKVLRKLELRLLAAGVTVSRTADDLIRYHGKMMIVDDRILHVYGFNLTRLDIAKSRSLGVITKNREAGAGSAQAVQGRRLRVSPMWPGAIASSSARRTPASGSPRSSAARASSCSSTTPR